MRRIPRTGFRLRDAITGDNIRTFSTSMSSVCSACVKAASSPGFESPLSFNTVTAFLDLLSTSTSSPSCSLLTVSCLDSRSGAATLTLTPLLFFLPWHLLASLTLLPSMKGFMGRHLCAFCAHPAMEARSPCRSNPIIMTAEIYTLALIVAFTWCNLNVSGVSR